MLVGNGGRALPRCDKLRLEWSLFLLSVFCVPLLGIHGRIFEDKFIGRIAGQHVWAVYEVKLCQAYGSTAVANLFV